MQPRRTHSLDNDSSTTGSDFTYVTRSTVWGPGALTGKALKAVRETGLDMVMNLVIRVRLESIKQTLKRNPVFFVSTGYPEDMQKISRDLEELCRRCYSLGIRETENSLLVDICAKRLASIEDAFNKTPGSFISAESPGEMQGMRRDLEEMCREHYSHSIRETANALLVDLGARRLASIEETLNKTPVLLVRSEYPDQMQHIGRDLKELTRECYSPNTQGHANIMLIDIIARQRLVSFDCSLLANPQVFAKPQGPSDEEDKMNEWYDDLEELCREGYSPRTRNEAIRLVDTITQRYQPSFFPLYIHSGPRSNPREPETSPRQVQSRWHDLAHNNRIPDLADINLFLAQREGGIRVTKTVTVSIGTSLISEWPRPHILGHDTFGRLLLDDVEPPASDCPHLQRLSQIIEKYTEELEK